MIELKKYSDNNEDTTDGVHECSNDVDEEPFFIDEVVTLTSFDDQRTRPCNRCVLGLVAFAGAIAIFSSVAISKDPTTTSEENSKKGFPLERKDDYSTFPGMDDNETCIEGCSPRVMAELYHWWLDDDEDEPPPFSTLLLYSLQRNNETRPIWLESTCASQSCQEASFPPYCKTFPSYMETCTVSQSLESFIFYTDGHRYVLEMSWFRKNCFDMINRTDVERTIPIDGGHWTGYVHPNRNEVYVPDVSDSCWRLDCECDEFVDCVESIQEDLRHASLKDFVLEAGYPECE